MLSVSFEVPTAEDEIVLAEILDPIGASLAKLQNKHRVCMGLNRLTWDTELTFTSCQKAQDMAVHRHFDHFSPRLGFFGDQLAAIGYEYLAWAENIGRFDPRFTPEGMLEAFLASEPHRAAIENPVYTRQGICAVQSAFTDEIYVAVHFTLPL